VLLVYLTPNRIPFSFPAKSHLPAQSFRVFLFPFTIILVVFYPYPSMFSLTRRLIAFTFRFFAVIQLPAIFPNRLSTIISTTPSLVVLNSPLPLRLELTASFPYLSYSILIADSPLFYLTFPFCLHLLLLDLAPFIFSDARFLLLILMLSYFHG